MDITSPNLLIHNANITIFREKEKYHEEKNYKKRLLPITGRRRTEGRSPTGTNEKRSSHDDVTTPYIYRLSRCREAGENVLYSHNFLVLSLEHCLNLLDIFVMNLLDCVLRVLLYVLWHTVLY